MAQEEEREYDRMRDWEREQEFYASESAKAESNAQSGEGAISNANDTEATFSKPDERLLTPEEVFIAEYEHPATEKDKEHLEDYLVSSWRGIAKAQDVKTSASKDAEYQVAIKEASELLADNHKKQLEQVKARYRQRIEQLFEEIEDKWAFDQAHGRAVYSCNLTEYQALKEKCLSEEVKDERNANDPRQHSGNS